jgi:hypothetical protein
MEVAHQYFEIEVPEHLKTTELVPIVIAGESQCSQHTIAAQLCGAEMHDSLRSASSPLRGRAQGGLGPVNIFSAGRWCPRGPPEIYFHPTCLFASAAAMFKGQQSTHHPSLVNSMSAHVLVASHSQGVGCAGPRAEVVCLAPLFLLPHATVVWNTRLSSWQQPSTVLLSLCRTISAARVANAHLASAHPSGWETSRGLLVVLHDDLGTSAAPALSTMLRHAAPPPCSSTATSASIDEEEEQYQQLILDGAEGAGEAEGGVESAVRRISMQTLLSVIPKDQRQLLQSAFGTLDAIAVPRGLGEGASLRFVVTPGQQDDHRLLVEHVMAAASSSVHRLRSTAVASHSTQFNSAPLVRPGGTDSRGATTAPNRAATHPAALPTAVLLSRYFAECAVRVPHDVLYGLPFVGGTEAIKGSSHKPSTAPLRRLQAEFAVEDALSDLERVIVQNLSTNATWLSLVQQPAETCGSALVASSRHVESGVGGAVHDVVLPTSSAATLDDLCRTESDRIFSEYFNAESDPRAAADYRTAAEVLIDELKRDASRRSAEAQRALLQKKLLERLDAVAPLLEKLLATGRFVH